MFYNLEILPRDSVLETTGKTMQAGHVGGTPLMVSDLMGKAKGGVLLIDGPLNNSLFPNLFCDYLFGVL